MRFSPGLRSKFNAVILPVLALTFGLMVAADYRHEVGTVMTAHAMHEALAAHEETEKIAGATAAILAAVRGLDHAFDATFQRTKGGARS